VILEHVEPILFLSLVTHLPTCINLTTYYLSALYLDSLGFGIFVWIDLLSPTIISYRTSLPSFIILSWLVV
jgi:hypothetical protein